jgi:hypothetical protein
MYPKWNGLAALWNHRYSLWNYYHSTWNCLAAAWNYLAATWKIDLSLYLKPSESGLESGIGKKISYTRIGYGIPEDCITKGKIFRLLEDKFPGFRIAGFRNRGCSFLDSDEPELCNYRKWQSALC